MKPCSTKGLKQLVNMFIVALLFALATLLGRVLSISLPVVLGFVNQRVFLCGPHHLGNVLICIDVCCQTFQPQFAPQFSL